MSTTHQASQLRYRGTAPNASFEPGPQAMMEQPSSYDGARPGRPASYMGFTRRRYFFCLVFLTSIATFLYYRSPISMLSTQISAYGQTKQKGDSEFSPLRIPWTPRQRSILACQGPYTPSFLNSTPPSAASPEDAQGRPYDLIGVVILQRHTARYPTPKALAKILHALNKIERLPSVASGGQTRSLEDYVKFVESWKSRAGELTDEGRRTAHEFGILYRSQYAGLLGTHAEDRPGVFVRSSGSGRVVETAGYLINGMMNRTFHIGNKSDLPKPDVVFPVGKPDKGRNPIGESESIGPEYDHYAAVGSKISRSYLHTWASSVLPHLRRILGEKPGETLQGVDALALMSLCAFETQQPITGLGMPVPWSSWCDTYRSLGGERELAAWEGYAKWYDITKWHIRGPGNPAAVKAGLTWVEDLNQRVRDLGATSNDKDKTLSIVGPRVYIDLSHDNRMLAIYTALGILFNSPDNYNQGQLSPFGMVLIVDVYISHDGKEVTVRYNTG